MYKTIHKKTAAVFMALAIILSCSNIVSASEKKAFKIRWSSDYSFSNVYVMVTTTNSSGTEGTISLVSDISINLPEGGSVHLNAGTTWDYKITSIKDGSKITLVTDFNKKTGAKTDRVSYIALCESGMAKMTGKIHISGTKKFYNIWKIDAFTRFYTPNGIAPKAWNDGSSYRYTSAGIERPGFYFRDT